MADSQAYRRRFLLGNCVFLCVVLMVLGAVFLVRDILSAVKLDLTRDQIYTISAETREVLLGLLDDVNVTYYVNRQLPAGMQDLRRDTRDFFEECFKLSSGRFQYEIVDPEAEAAAYAEAKVEEYYEARKEGKAPSEPRRPSTFEDIASKRREPTDEETRAAREETARKRASGELERTEDEIYRDLLRYDFRRQYLAQLRSDGIPSFSVTERQAASVRTVQVYSAIRLRHLEKSPEILPVHRQLESLEYELSRRMVKLTNDVKPIVVLFDGRRETESTEDSLERESAPGDYTGIIEQLEEQFHVQPIRLEEGDSLDDLVATLKTNAWRREQYERGDRGEPPQEVQQVLPEDLQKYVQVFVVARPDRPTRRQLYEINRAVSLGVPTIFLVSRYSTDVSENGIEEGMPVTLLSPGVEQLFQRWGIELGSEILASNYAGSVEVPVVVEGMRTKKPEPISVNVAASSETIEPDSPLTRRIYNLFFPACVPLRLLPETLRANNLQVRVLATTTDASWAVRLDPSLHARQIRVAQFPDLVGEKDPEQFAGFIDRSPLAVLLEGKLPFLFDGDSSESGLEPAQGKALILSSVDMLKNDFLSQRNGQYRSNSFFLENIVESFSLYDQLTGIRRRHITLKKFKPGSDRAAPWILWLNLAGVPLFVSALGCVHYLLRRATSQRYERSFVKGPASRDVPT